MYVLGVSSHHVLSCSGIRDLIYILNLNIRSNFLIFSTRPFLRTVSFGNDSPGVSCDIPWDGTKRKMSFKQAFINFSIRFECSLDLYRL